MHSVLPHWVGLVVLVVLGGQVGQSALTLSLLQIYLAILTSYFW